MADDRTTSGDGDRFTPTNPCLRGILSLFRDEKTADVVFDVDSKEKFHAHRLILRACAPALAEYCDGAEDVSSVPVTGVEPNIFRHMLHYVYGGTVPESVLSEHCKDIINAADRFGIGSLKVEAEGFYVKSTPITLDNFVDNLQFSDAKKCALLKETVMEFLVRNETAALYTLSEQDVPQSESMLTDFLTASARQKCKRKQRGDDLKTMPINKMRKILDQRGLNVDGTREMLSRDLVEHWIAKNGIVVEGAGTQSINGVYKRSGSYDGAPKYTRDAVHAGKVERFTLFRFKYPGGRKRWHISIIPMDEPPGGEGDIDFYQAPDQGEDVPPRNGWEGFEGVSPGPAILVNASDSHIEDGPDDSSTNTEDGDDDMSQVGY